MIFGMVHANILKNNIHPLKRKKESLNKTQLFSRCLLIQESVMQIFLMELKIPGKY